MVAHIKTVSFQGLDVQTVDAQVLMTSGLPKVNIVGLPERAVGESKERVRGALAHSRFFCGAVSPSLRVSGTPRAARPSTRRRAERAGGERDERRPRRL